MLGFLFRGLVFSRLAVGTYESLQAAPKSTDFAPFHFHFEGPPSSQNNLSSRFSRISGAACNNTSMVWPRLLCAGVLVMYIYIIQPVALVMTQGCHDPADFNLGRNFVCIFILFIFVLYLFTFVHTFFQKYEHVYEYKFEYMII